MAIDFTVQNQASQMFSQTATSSNTAAAAGSLMGQAAVMINDPMSLLANCAEEMTFAADTTDEFELEERKEREGANLDKSKEVQRYQELMREGGQAEQMGKLKDSIKGKIGAEHALRQAREFFSDDSDAYVALQDCYDELKKEGASKEVLDGIQGAMLSLEKEAGSEIKAGIIATLNADGFSELGSDTKILYRTAVCDFQSVNDLFAHIQTKYGDNFELALSFLYKSIASDLASDAPSVDKKELEYVNSNLGEMRSLQSAFALCDGLLNRWENVHQNTDSKLTSMELLGKIVGLRNEIFLGANNIEAIAKEAMPKDIEQEVLFLQELLNSTRQFATSLFEDNQGRMKVIDAVQSAVDNAITREDEYLANQI